MSTDESQWVVAPDERRIEVAIGKEAKLSPDLRAALDQLARALEADNEVSGYINCQKVSFDPNCDFYMVCKGVTL